MVRTTLVTVIGNFYMVGNFHLGIWPVPGWVYYHISNAMKYSNTALETTALVMYDPNTFFYTVPRFLMALRIS